METDSQGSFGISRGSRGPCGFPVRGLWTWQEVHSLMYWVTSFLYEGHQNLVLTSAKVFVIPMCPTYGGVACMGDLSDFERL